MEHGLLVPCHYHILGCQHHPGKAFICSGWKYNKVSRQGGEPSPILAVPPLSPARLTCNAQGEVLAAAGLAKGIVGTAGVEATVFRTGWSKGQIPLLAADCVVALTVRDGGPISEPLVGGPVGQRRSVARRKGYSVERTERPLSLHMEKLRPEEGKCTNAHIIQGQN